MAKFRYLNVSEEEVYGRYPAEGLDQSVLERFFFLDDADLEVVGKS